ncbi:hypothetical protein BKA70DRAFT_1436095 [Coprinopsis sp. MPI-PUGE-AT-0042]|nr:hypothetical protein BKA70DRAFT_1436095 [Coprinopsis sp. MPI-PUGE-AT-0042]
MYNLLEISLSASAPDPLQTTPVGYNITMRLWTNAFHKVLESLRRVSFQSPIAFEHLQDFIYYACTFYTSLLEEPTLNVFKSSWMKALGDPAASSPPSAAGDVNFESISNSPTARLDDSPSPSIGIVAAQLMELEPEEERWRNIARNFEL